MKWSLIILLAAAAMTPVSTACGEKKAETHRHPDLPISFKTFEGWHRVPRPGDEGTFEMASPGGTLNVMVWYTSTEQDARRYLLKMADMKGLELPAGAEPDTISTGPHEAIVFEIPGTLLAVIDNGRSMGYPAENALYIVQISCPRQEYGEHRELMHRILGTVRITGEGGR
jgi:hypothetical protein